MTNSATRQIATFLQIDMHNLTLDDMVKESLGEYVDQYPEDEIDAIVTEFRSQWSMRLPEGMYLGYCDEVHGPGDTDQMDAEYVIREMYDSVGIWTSVIPALVERGAISA